MNGQSVNVSAIHFCTMEGTSRPSATVRRLELLVDSRTSLLYWRQTYQRS